MNKIQDIIMKTKMKTKIKAYRHGEILLVKTNKIPKEAKERTGNLLLVGSHGNPHRFTGGKIYNYQNNFIFGYLKAQDTILYHQTHGDGKGKLKSCKIPNGIYELRKGQEYVNEEMKPIID